jgi:hypothetical protein
MAEFLLVAHVLSAAAWLGGSLLTGFVGPRMAQAGAEASLGWARVAVQAGARYFNPVGILTALSGIGLVVVSDQYGWADTFVSIGLGVVLAAAVIGAAVFTPGGRRIVTALESGNFADAAGEGKKTAIWGVVISALLIVAVIVMVLKTGSG